MHFLINACSNIDIVVVAIVIVFDGNAACLSKLRPSRRGKFPTAVNLNQIDSFNGRAAIAIKDNAVGPAIGLIIAWRGARN